MTMEPIRRPVVTPAWGPRAMRNPMANVRRYDPNGEDLRTGKRREEGTSQSPNTIDLTPYCEVAGDSITGMLSNSPTVDGGSSLTMGTKMFLVFTGSTATWTLPALSTRTGYNYWIKNRGSGNLTVQRAGSDELYDTAARTSITITAGQGCFIHNDGTYWNVLIKA